jgi:hypothetical protein
VAQTHPSSIFAHRAAVAVFGARSITENVDGFAAGPKGELDFVTEAGAASDLTSGPFVEDQLAFIESLDTILLGAVTYRMFAAYWPEQTTETQAISDALNATPKVVFSSTLESAPWGRWEPARVTKSVATYIATHRRIA